MTFRLPILGLNDSNFPTDGQILSYKASEDKFEWISNLGLILGVGLLLPGLRSYWVAGGVSTGATLQDYSSQAHGLPDVGAPEYGYDGLIPYAELDGANDYFRLADAGWQDILGTETYVQAAYRGLTLGGWFYSDTSTAAAHLMSKWGAVDNNRSYFLEARIGNTIRFGIEDPADTLQIIETTTTFVDDTWYFIAGRFDPSTEIKVWQNADSEVNVAGIVASLRNSTAGFSIGARDDGGNKLDGRFSQGFLCAMMLGDDLIDNYFQSTRAFYGV